jgi:hypothetical protein
LSEPGQPKYRLFWLFSYPQEKKCSVAGIEQEMIDRTSAWQMADRLPVAN